MDVFSNDSMIFYLPGEVIKHGDVKCIMNEGMPTHKNPFEKGRLIITFAVTFPADNWIQPTKLGQLESLLPKRNEVIIPDGSDECIMVRYDPEADRQRGKRQEAYDSDDDGPQHGQRVQCAQH